MKNKFDWYLFLQLLENKKLPDFRWQQFLDFYFSKEIKEFPKWENFTTWSKNLKAEFAEEMPLNNIKSYKVEKSADGRSYKAILLFNDNTAIETVLMTYKDYNTVCLSSQVGCALNCQFCATGMAGFTRNLEVDEILEQYQLWLILLNNGEVKANSKNIRNLVFMGMGEPFNNWDNVKNAIYLFHDYYNIGYRHITVSTAGILKGMRDFAEEKWQVNLAISLHACFNKTRNILMPINEVYDIKKIWKFLRYYFRLNNRKVFLEYILIDDLNDSLKEFDCLVEKIKSINPKLLHVNLIPYNPVEGKPWESSKKEQIKKIENLLKKNKIHYTIRKSLGADIGGACGQLKNKTYVK